MTATSRPAVPCVFCRHCKQALAKRDPDGYVRPLGPIAVKISAASLTIRCPVWEGHDGTASSQSVNERFVQTRPKLLVSQVQGKYDVEQAGPNAFRGLGPAQKVETAWMNGKSRAPQASRYRFDSGRRLSPF